MKKLRCPRKEGGARKAICETKDHMTDQEKGSQKRPVGATKLKRPREESISTGDIV